MFCRNHLERSQMNLPQPVPSSRQFPTGRIVWLLLAITGALFADAFLRARGDFDYALINGVRSIRFPGDERTVDLINTLTGTEGALIAWFVVLIAFIVARQWLAAVAMAMMPTGGIISIAMQDLVGRSRPDLSRIDGLEGMARAAEDQDLASFPSGHVLGAVLLYGLLFFLAGKIRQRPLRVASRSVLLMIPVVAGFSRVWGGSHWAGDTVTAFALGGAMLSVMIILYRRAAPYVEGTPFIHAKAIPHDELLPHAHALTSTILFRDGEVWKVYSPGFFPRAIYWLSFQAPFPYAHNEAAQSAAISRRNLAGLLTEYWYGERRVAPALRVDHVDGRPAIVGRFIAGDEPGDLEGAKAFLFDVCKRFDDAGLPTWQVDPRQPRSLGNLVQTNDGRFTIIDLESGMVSPLASPRAWWRAISRAMVPLFDDVYYDITRDYIEREAEAMRTAKGDEWFETLQRTFDHAEQATIAWHAGERRLWSWILREFFTAFGIRRWGHSIRRRSREGQVRATHWMESAIDRWQAESRIAPEEARELREAVQTPEFQAVLPHFGVHLGIAVVLRFPFGSIARVLYTGGNLLFAFLLITTRRIDRHTFKRMTDIHSPLVLLVAAMPGIGTLSYMASKHVRSHGKLTRLALDAAGEKLPFHVYRRLGIRRIIAGKGTSAPPPGAAASA